MRKSGIGKRGPLEATAGEEAWSPEFFLPLEVKSVLSTGSRGMSRSGFCTFVGIHKAKMLGEGGNLTLAQDSSCLHARKCGRKAKKTPPWSWSSQGLPKTGTRTRELRNPSACARRFAANNKQQATAVVAAGTQSPFLCHKLRACSELGRVGKYREEPLGL